MTEQTTKIRRAIGALLLATVALSVIQSVRELTFSTPDEKTCNEEWIQSDHFTFAGHAITIDNWRASSADPDTTMVPQEQVFIDGVAIGQKGLKRMHTWPVLRDIRSPHWFDAFRYVDQVNGDSSVWLARRLQSTDSTPPVIEIVTIDARGRYTVQARSINELRTNYRTARVTQFIAEDAPSGFPLSVASFVLFPILFVLHPIGTATIGMFLVRRRTHVISRSRTR